MKKLDRFLLKQFIAPFFAILIVVIFVLMMHFLWLYIDELVGKGLSLKIILEFLMWGICTILPMALPLATLLASMMVVGNLAENKELMALKASGISLARIMAPLTVAAFFIAIGAFFSGSKLVPHAYNEIFTLRDDIGRTKDEIKIPRGTFYDGIEGYILRVDDQNKDNGMMYGVMVYDHTGNKGNTVVTLADSATMKMSKAKDYLVFTLFNGSNYQETNNRSYRDTTLDLQHITFARQELIIPLENYSFQKSDSSRFGDQVKCLSIDDLRFFSDSLDTQIQRMHDDNLAAFVKCPSIYMHRQLDTSVHSGATLPFEYEGMGDWKTLAERAKAYQNASFSADRLVQDVTSYGHNVYEFYYYVYKSDTELLVKFAQALACFILFFIGAPLGALIKKGGLGTSAIVSVLFFVLYYIVDISSTKLSRDGNISAVAGAFSASMVLIPIGAFLTWKAVNDSEIFNMDSISNWWRMTKSRISRFFRPVRIVYMGTPEFAVAPLDALVKKGYNIAGVVTVADKPAGRGLKVNQSAVKQYAVEHGIPVLQPVKLKDPEFLEALKAWNADMFVVVAFRMLPEEVWKMPRLGTFNLHAALLPQYRGAAPINWAVINGERMTGVTTFMIDKNIDTGGIILREECRISDTDTAGDVHDRLMEMGAGLVVQTVEGIIQRNVETRVQRSFIQGSEVLKPAPKITRETCRIDWNDTTEHIYNLIRGLSPYPTAFTEIAGPDGNALQLKIFTSERSDLHAEPGTILSDGKTYLAIATSDGAISIKDLQLSGKKRMDVKAFLLGFRDPQNWRTLDNCA